MPAIHSVRAVDAVGPIHAVDAVDAVGPRVCSHTVTSIASIHAAIGRAMPAVDPAIGDPIPSAIACSVDRPVRDPVANAISGADIRVGRRDVDRRDIRIRRRIGGARHRSQQ